MLISLWRLWSHCWDSRNPPQFIRFSHIYIYTYCIYTYIYNYISYSIFLNLRIIYQIPIYSYVFYLVYIYIVIYIYIYTKWHTSMKNRSWERFQDAADGTGSFWPRGGQRPRLRRWEIQALRAARYVAGAGWSAGNAGGGGWGHAAAMVGPKEAKPLRNDLWWFMMVYQW